MHEDQIEVLPETVQLLIADQFPEWAHLPLKPLATAATVNSIFRLGDDLTVRFPLLRQDPMRARTLLEREADASSEFAAVSPVPAPRPVALGRPGHGYPMPWSVQTWLPGRDATQAHPAMSMAFAKDLVALLTALRQSETRGRWFNGQGRGGHLPDHDEWMEECFSRSEGMLNVARLRAVWADMRALPEIDGHVMTHGDLTPPNVLVEARRLAGVLDTGSFAPADPALDLVGAWHLLDASGRGHVRALLGCSDVQWRRGMAWAFEQATGLVWYYAESNPDMARWGRRTLERLLAAPELQGVGKGPYGAVLQRRSAATSVRAMRALVASGQGELAQWMRRYADAYEQAVGAALEPGSLNVELDEPWVMHQPEARLEASEVGVGVGLVPCRLNDHPCWVIRTDRNNAGIGHHPLTVVEVVSTLHLRSALGLRDGDEVRLEVGR